ncbi:DUF5818 domain-containing protein [Sphingomonas xinjiangensis]
MRKRVRVTGELMRSGSGGAIIDQQGNFWRLELDEEHERLIGRYVLVDGVAAGERIRVDYLDLLPGGDA